MKRLLTLTVLFLLFAFRIFLSINAKHGDMYNNLDWGRATVELGPWVVYDQPQKSWPHSWPNQPPGSLLWHSLSTILFDTFTTVFSYLNTHVPAFPSKLIWWWELHGSLVSIKLPSIFADFAAAAAILYIGKTFGKVKAGRVAALAYLMNPAIWYNSSFWGQTDPIVAALSFWSIALMFSQKLFLSPIFLGLSFITKASWAPLIPLYFIYWLKKYPRQLPYLVLIPIIMLIVSLPFHPQWDLVAWEYNIYLNRFLPGESAFITVLAFNFWNLVYGPDFLPENIAFLGLPANIVGWIVVTFFMAIFVIRLWRNPAPKNFLYLAACLSFAVFLFAPKMIHRYLFPFFPSFTALLIFSKDRTYWFILGLLSACYLVNIYYLWFAPNIPSLVLLYTVSFTKIISIIYLSVFAFLYAKKI